MSIFFNRFKSLFYWDSQETYTLSFRIWLSIFMVILLFIFDVSDNKTAETAIEKYTKAISADICETVSERINNNK